MQVKICGLNDPAAFAAAADPGADGAGADWVGFVFFPRSPRAVTPDQAAALAASRPQGPARVGLFVDPTDAEVAAALAALRLDALQLYAPPARVAALAARFGVPVWHAIGIASPADLPRDAGAAARLVIEAKPPPGATRPGGNAATFDWTLLRGWSAPAPWILAGGLTPETVGAAIAASGATAVDVSSGVESAPGVKDPARIRAFLAAARASVPPLTFATLRSEREGPAGH